MITGQIEPCIRNGKESIFNDNNKAFIFFALLLFRFFSFFLSHGSLARTMSYLFKKSYQHNRELRQSHLKLN